MITVLTAVTPLMMAAPVDNAATMPEAPVAYNWASQNANELISEDDMKLGANGSFSFIPGSRGQQTVDDWHLC